MAGTPPLAGTVAAPPPDSAYFSALQTAMQPGFNQQANALAAQEAAMGTLTSGQGVNDFSSLANNQNATYAAQAAPMIDQGFQQQFAANSQNASAANALQSLLQQQSYGAAQSNADRTLQAGEFNSGQNFALQSQDMSAQNQLQLAQMGYGNSDYLAQLNAISGLEGTGLNSLGNIIGSGQGNQFAGYGMGAQQGAAAGQAQGYNQGYGSGNTVSPIGGGYSGYDPNSGTGSFGSWTDPNLAANVVGGDSAPLG